MRKGIMTMVSSIFVVMSMGFSASVLAKSTALDDWKENPQKFCEQVHNYCKNQSTRYELRDYFANHHNDYFLANVTPGDDKAEYTACMEHCIPICREYGFEPNNIPWEQFN